MTVGVAVLGSTGSIGQSTLRVLSRHSDKFHVAALTAYSNAELLARQALQTSAGFVGIIEARERPNVQWHAGADCLTIASTLPEVSIVVNAVVGVAGMDATLGALRAGKRVALANKESLVVAGRLALDAARTGGGEIVPVDSEHSAILQCLAGRRASDIRRLVLTASGGPFRDWGSDRLQDATLADALRHPTWRMGRKISVDSATLANKALEVIEAHYLFGVPYDRIEVVVHPQSIVHSMVEFVDGSVLAQVGVPSMELPILYALTHPLRVEDLGIDRFDAVTSSPLTFEAVRGEDFPAFALGVEAGRRGGVAPAVFNAANECAVGLFLDGRIRFGDISRAIDAALSRAASGAGRTREELLAADAAARALVKEYCLC
ncbi:MAG: 1-deoxy-D-xylulose 5-phosphate reductoisomerase [Gemmatimonadaceae bacterium]|nr:1-deoxy-D-xylulose 5-phosphate reductoisomerase [Gemmatimonadaceae bacterium]